MTEKGYYDGCRRLGRETDIEVVINIVSIDDIIKPLDSSSGLLLVSDSLNIEEQWLQLNKPSPLFL